MTTLARQVQLRHHEVVYLALPVVEPLVRAIGLPFASFGKRESLSALTENLKG
jgi:UDP:flavonoid glycosyltransferase YjiC (YdhE family)